MTYTFFAFTHLTSRRQADMRLTFEASAIRMPTTVFFEQAVSAYRTSSLQDASPKLAYCTKSRDSNTRMWRKNR